MIFNTFFLISIFFLLYFFQILIWQQIFNHFRVSKIYYEESSWFDTKICQKLCFLIKKDKFFASQKIKGKIRQLNKIQKLFSLFFIVFYFLS